MRFCDSLEIFLHTNQRTMRLISRNKTPVYKVVLNNQEDKMGCINTKVAHRDRDLGYEVRRAIDKPGLSFHEKQLKSIDNDVWKYHERIRQQQYRGGNYW